MVATEDSSLLSTHTISALLLAIGGLLLMFRAKSLAIRLIICALLVTVAPLAFPVWMHAYNVLPLWARSIIYIATGVVGARLVLGVLVGRDTANQVTGAIILRLLTRPLHFLGLM